MPNVLALCSLTRTLPSLSDLHERIKSTAIEHGLQLNHATTRTFIRLFNQALEEFLVKIITTTLTTITRSDSQYESIQLPGNMTTTTNFFSAKSQNEKVTISAMSLATTFYITPSLLSFPSPAVLRVMMQDFQWSKEEEESQSKGQKYNLGAKPMADYVRLLRASRSGGPPMIQEYGNFQ
jgi:predicted NAD/FAD-dependent oxidoreductase